MAVSVYDKNNLSAQQQANLAELTNQYDQIRAGAGGNITADIQAQLDGINSSANAIRSQAGYSGGSDGLQHITGDNGSPTTSPIISGTSQESYINQLSQAQQAAALAALQAAYEKNKITADATAAKIPAIYQGARNQTAGQAAQGQANFNEQAAASGINSGAGSQAALSMSNQLSGNLTGINTNEANAKTDLETQRLQMSVQYENAVAQAIAEGNMQKAQMLLDEAIRIDNSLVAQSQAQADENYRQWAASNQFNQQQQASQQQQAENLAAFGDFSGFLAQGYTQEQVDQMYSVWAAKNPLLAQAVKGRGANAVGAFSSGGGGKLPVKPPEDEKDDGGYVPPAPKETNAQSLANLDRKLGALEDRGVGVVGNATTLIKNYLTQKLITESQAESLLARYGI